MLLRLGFFLVAFSCFGWGDTLEMTFSYSAPNITGVHLFLDPFDTSDVAITQTIYDFDSGSVLASLYVDSNTPVASAIFTSAMSGAPVAASSVEVVSDVSFELGTSQWDFSNEFDVGEQAPEPRLELLLGLWLAALAVIRHRRVQ